MTRRRWNRRRSPGNRRPAAPTASGPVRELAECRAGDASGMVRRIRRRTLRRRGSRENSARDEQGAERKSNRHEIRLFSSRRHAAAQANAAQRARARNAKGRDLRRGDAIAAACRPRRNVDFYCVWIPASPNQPDVSKSGFTTINIGARAMNFIIIIFVHVFVSLPS